MAIDRRDYAKFFATRKKFIASIRNLKEIYLDARREYFRYSEQVLRLAYQNSRDLLDVERNYEHKLHHAYIQAYFNYMEMQERLKSYELQFKYFGDC